MLLSESCHLLGLKQSGMIHSTLKSAIKMELHTQLTRKKSAFYTTLRGSKTGCQIQKNVQCFRLGGRLNSNLLTKKTHSLRCPACKQWLSRVEFLDLARFVRSLDGMQLIGTNFQGSARRGSAGHGEARRGAARHGMANTLLPLRRGQQFGGARQGAARRGSAWHGVARHGMANTLPLLQRGQQFGGAGLGRAWRGLARQGLAGQGTANTLFTLRSGQQFAE